MLFHQDNSNTNVYSLLCLLKETDWDLKKKRFLFRSQTTNIPIHKLKKNPAFSGSSFQLNIDVTQLTIRTQLKIIFRP